MHNLVVLIAKYLVFIPPLVWLVVLVRLPKRQRLGFVILSALAAILTAVLVKIGTSVHQDPRPFVRDHVHPYFASSTDNGFPSDHTAFSALLAFIVMRYNRWLGVGLLVIAALIGTARVISGVHHGQDVIGGLLFALFGVRFAHPLERMVKRMRSSPLELDS